MRSFIAFFVWVILCVTAQAEVFTVDATDPSADFQVLYDAVNAVPSGSVLMLLSDIDELACCGGAGAVEYFIDKDLTIIGDKNGMGGRPMINRGIFTIGAFGGTNARAKLRNIESTGAFDYHLVNVFPGGQVIIESCLFLDGGDEHDTLRVEGGFAIVNDSELRARGFDGNIQANAVTVFNGGVAVVKDSTLTMTSNPDWAIRAYINGTVYASGNTINGTIDIQPTAQLINLDQSSLQVTPDLSIGGPIGASGVFSSPTTMGLVFLGFDAQAPANPAQPLFLVPGSYLKLIVATGSWNLAGNIPNNPILAGVPIYFQQFDANAGFSIVEARIIGE